MNLLDLYAKISIDTSAYEEGVRRAGDAGEELGRRSEGSGKKIHELGPITVAAGKLIADGFEKALSAAKDFAKFSVGSSIEYESAFAKVGTIMDDTQMSSGKMSESIKKLSSQMGISASDISNSVYDVISATGDTANSVSLVEKATKLAKGGFAETGDAVGVLTTAINAYGLSMEDAESISDSLITVQNLGVTTVGELSGAMGKAIASGASYGVNLSNLEAGYIALTKAGIGTAEATTYQSSMFKELGDAGSDVGEILKSKTGKSFGELMADGNSLADVLKILYDSVDGNSEAFMGLWGSAEAGKGAAAIAGQGFEQFNGWLGELENSAGATQKAYEKMSDTTQSKIDVIKTSVQNFASEAAQPFIDKAMEFAPKITEMIQSFDPSLIFDKVSEFFGLVKDGLGWIEEHQTIVEVAAAGIGAFLFVLEGVPAILTAISTAAAIAGGAIAFLTSPLTIVALAIGALIAIGVALYQNWDTVKQKCAELKDDLIAYWEALKTVVSEKVQALKTSVVNAWETLKTGVVTKVNALKTSISNAWDNIKTNVSNKVDAVKTAVSTKFDEIKTAISTKIEAARTAVSSAVEKIKGIFNFSWKLPDIKVPHFSVSGGEPPFGIMGKGSLPHISVSWYAKAMQSGYMFTSPTVLDTESGLKGFGDAGAEMVIGRDSMMQMISDAQNSGGVVGVLQEIKEELQDYKDNVGSIIATVLNNYGIKYNDREIARMIREVSA